jgi:hypothetical protein
MTKFGGRIKPLRSPGMTKLVRGQPASLFSHICRAGKAASSKTP